MKNGTQVSQTQGFSRNQPQSVRSDGIGDQKPQSNFKTPSVACEIVARRLLTVHKEGLTASVYTLPTHAHHRVTMATERE